LRGAKIARPQNCARAGGALALLLAVLRELERALLLREEAALAPPRRRRLGRRALRRGGRGRGRRRRRRAQQLVALRGERRREDGGRRDPPHAAAHGIVEAEQRVLQVEAAEPRRVRLPRVAVRARRARERLAARRVAADVDGGDRKLGRRVGFRLRRRGRLRPRRSGRRRRAVRREVERDRPGEGGGIARGQKIKFLRHGKGWRRTVRTC